MQVHSVVKINISENCKMTIEYLEPPIEQRFWRTLAYFLHMSSCLDVRWWGLPKPNFIFFILSCIMNYFCPMYMLSQFAYAYINFDDITLGQLQTMIFLIMLTSSAILKIRSSKTEAYKVGMIDFIKSIHLSNWQKNEFAKKRLFSLERYTRWTTVCLSIFVGIDTFLLSYIPIHYNISNSLKYPELMSNGTLKLMSSVYIIMPFDYAYNFRNWALMHAINMYCTFLGCILLVVFDAANYGMIFHLIGHVEILKNDLKMFAKEFEGMSELEVRRNLIELIEYHSFVVKAFKTLESAYGFNVTANYMFNLIIDSFVLFQIMTRSKLYSIIFSIVLLVLMGGCILMSFILEEIRKQSDGLADAVYTLPWEDMSVSNQKMLLLMLARVQPTLTFIGAGGMRTGVQPMISIIKSTFSYYVMLKSTI